VTQAPGAAPVLRARARPLVPEIVLPFAAGAGGVLGFAPFYAWPVPVLSLALLLHAWSGARSPARAALSGFCFGLGLFLAGVSWVYVSLHDFGSMPAPLAGAATLLFCAYLALFFAVAGWLAARFGSASSARRLALGAAALAATEWMRGWLFTGFPWLVIGVSQVPASPLAGFAPWVGAYGTTFAVALVAALFAGFVVVPHRRPAAAVLLVALFAAGWLSRGVEWTERAGEPVSIALLQGNVAQELKWRDETRSAILEAYRRMILAAPARIIVVPETALPAFLDQLPPRYVEELREHARAGGRAILLGTVERSPSGGDVDYHNSVVSLTSPGAYRKRHLVPFGEFIPPGFAWILRVLHIPMTDFARGAAAQPPLRAGGVAFGVAICYEDIFGEEVIDALPAAQVLLNVSNDAWFGRSLAADQHLQASQMRALETGRWMVRATNTGATAAIDAAGRVVSRLPAFTEGTLVAKVEPRGGATPYARLGNLPALLLMAALAAAAILAVPRGKR